MYLKVVGAFVCKCSTMESESCAPLAVRRSHAGQVFGKRMAHTQWLSLPLALGFAAALAAPAHSASTCSGAPGVASLNFAPPNFAPLPQSSPASRIAGDWSASAPVLLPAAMPPAPPEALDLGLAPGGLRLERMLLLLEPSAAQRQSLDAELTSLQTPGSCAYHHWLTPGQFADAFSNSAADVNAVADWLRSQGFTVAPLPSGRAWIEFSGTAAQVTQAFLASVHAYSTSAGTRFILHGKLSVPAALAPVIHGLVSLDGVFSVAAITAPQTVAAPPAALAAETGIRRAEALTPQLAAQVLHIDALRQGGGETVAIATRSNIQPQDIAAFRAAFGLPANAPVVTPAGPDPGLGSDQAATELAASWSGAAAPAARILVSPATDTNATDGVDLSLAAIIDQSQAHTVVVGYSACEAALGEPHRAWYATLYGQAAAQGISIVAAAGDSGAAACDPAGSDAAVTTGYAVNALASTPWNTAVGASAFAPAGDSTLAAWSPLNPADPAYAGGGGRSAAYALPAWQPALPGGSQGRLLPDLSLPTGLDTAFSRGLAFCFSGSGPASGCTLVRSGGSGAAAAIFGGISALIAVQDGPQGNLAPRLFALRSRTGIFNDVQQGSALLVCAAGSSGCDASGAIGYQAAAGFDLATGLGVPDVGNLLAAWATPDATGTAASTVALSVSPTQLNVTYNPSASVTSKVTPGTGGATPTGSIDFFDQTTGSNLNSAPYTLDSTATASITVAGAMPVGGNNIVAKYSGDATYAAQNSQALTVNIQPSTTTPTVTPSTTSPAVGASFSVTVSIAVGTPPAGTAPPSGKVTLTLDGNPYSTASLTTASGTTSASFTVSVASAGGHNLQAIYAGDANYSASTSATVTVTASKAGTVTTLVATPPTLTPGTPESFTAAIAASNSVSGTTPAFTGTVTFYDGATQLGTATVSSNAATLSDVTLSSGVTHTITAVYSGDDTWGASTSNVLTLKAALLPVTVALAASPTTAAPGQVVTFTATVTPTTAPASSIEQNPTGNVVFYNGTTILAAVPLSAAASNTATAQLLFTTLPAGQNTITAAYLGDLYYAAATSNAVTVTVQDFSITPSPSNPPSDLDIIKGESGQASFLFTGLGGFNGQLRVTCAVPAGDDMTCTPSSTQITPGDTVTFTVTTYLTGGPSGTAAHRTPAPLWPPAAGGTVLAALFFFLLPTGRRMRLFHPRGHGFLTMLLFLGSLGVAGIGCSEVSGTIPNSQGTPLGQTTLTITAAADVDNTVFSHSAYLSVNVLPPGATGTAQPIRGGR